MERRPRVLESTALANRQAKAYRPRKMKALFWFLTFLFGAWGVLSLLRGLELLIFAGRLRLGVLLFGILALAARCRTKARSI